MYACIQNCVVHYMTIIFPARQYVSIHFKQLPLKETNGKQFM